MIFAHEYLLQWRADFRPILKIDGGRYPVRASLLFPDPLRIVPNEGRGRTGGGGYRRIGRVLHRGTIVT